MEELVGLNIERREDRREQTSLPRWHGVSREKLQSLSTHESEQSIDLLVPLLDTLVTVFLHRVSETIPCLFSLLIGVDILNFDRFLDHILYKNVNIGYADFL